MTSTDVEEAALALEARLITRYLVDRDPEPPMVARYVAANRIHFPKDAADIDRVVAYARRHPRALPFLDAASGFLRPGSLLRKKILLMAAVLETTPTFAPDFLPRTSGAVALLLRLALLGIAAGLKVVVGAALLVLAGGKRP